MTMNVPLKPTDYANLEAQPVAIATRTAAGASVWVPNVAYMVAGAAIFFLGAVCALLAAPHPHIAAGGAGAGALASTRAVKFPWSGTGQLWVSMDGMDQDAWCSDNAPNNVKVVYSKKELFEYNLHCGR
jgi:hypothetical protein